MDSPALFRPHHHDNRRCSSTQANSATACSELPRNPHRQGLDLPTLPLTRAFHSSCPCRRMRICTHPRCCGPSTSQIPMHANPKTSLATRFRPPIALPTPTFGPTVRGSIPSTAFRQPLALLRSLLRLDARAAPDATVQRVADQPRPTVGTPSQSAIRAPAVSCFVLHQWKTRVGPIST